MLVRIILSALSLSSSFSIGFASEGTTSLDPKSKLSCIGERLFQDAWEYSKGNYSYYQSFFEPFYKEILDTDVNKVREKRIRLMETSRRIYSAVASKQVESNTRIPHTTHRVWITNAESPHEIPTERLQTYFNNLGILEGNDWEHIFWCLDKTKIPQTVQAIENSGKNIVVRELSEIMPQFRGKGVYERLYNGKYYTAVSDVVRFNLLNIFGGIYSDFGAVFKVDLTPLLDKFDYLFGQEGYLVGTTFVAAQARSPVFNAVLEFIDNLDRVPVEYRSWGDHIVTPRWTALGILTLMMDHYTMESDRVLPIPYGEDSLVKTNHMGSWLGETPMAIALTSPQPSF
ncbi:glycosyltransferase [Candidatus Finniella inopinata]|nr:glycosyltransferase [Candidatus Finniella inopinata]